MMASPGERAIAACEIEDVFLILSECRVNRDYNQSQLRTEIGMQHRFALDRKVLSQERTPVNAVEETIHVLRYFVEGEVRVLADKVSPDKAELADEDIVAAIKMQFGIDYRCSKSFMEDLEAVGSFGRNVILHSYPFWREAVHETAARMGLPRINIPMMKPQAVLPAQNAVEIASK